MIKKLRERWTQLPRSRRAFYLAVAGGGLFGLVVVGELLAAALGATYAYVILRIEPAKTWLKDLDLTPEQKEMKALRARFDRLGFNYFKDREEYEVAIEGRSYREDPVYREHVIRKRQRSEQIGIDLSGGGNG